MKNEMISMLKENIIPFWSNLKDEENGGFYGRVDFDLKVDKSHDKGVILNSRILWFFSKAHLFFKDDITLNSANHAYNFMINKCMDKENGGVYWSLNYKGEVQEDIKHTYNQAFAIYALSAYYEATKNENALNQAFELYNIIESKCKDIGGYLESFSKEFKLEDNEKLSENGVIAYRTMNTLLHVFEAYSALYEITKDEKVGNSMRFILDIYINKVFNYELIRQEVFFDKDYNSIIDLHSYGHDIESAWLMEWGTSLLNDEELMGKVSDISTKMADKVLEKAYRKNSIYNENENGEDDKTRVWWVQAEAVVGYINEWRKNPSQIIYKNVAEKIFKFINKRMIDERSNSEWYWEVDDNLEPTSKKDIVEPWKCPYHNGRMCLEIIRRL